MSGARGGIDRRQETELVELERRLRALLPEDTDFSDRARAEYASDASNYRVLPTGVVRPHSADDIVEVRSVCDEFGIPLTTRGGGTSVAGNSIGTGVVMDLSRHMHRLISIDPDARTARVEPGAVLSTIQRAAQPFGLRFGPDPSTYSRCTIGGVMGNNACGPHSLAFGRAAESIVEMDWLTGSGDRFVAGAGTASVPGLEELVASNLAVMRTEFGRFPRQVSGYSLEHLLPENGRNLARALVGTEGTCGVMLGGTITLQPLATVTVLVVLGYDSMAEAADDVPTLLPLRPLAMEGLDHRIVDAVRRSQGAGYVPELPAGAGWLFVQVAGSTEAEAVAAADLLAATSSAVASARFPAGPLATRLWQIRADGAGLAGRTAAGEQAWPGWEDAAVPPEHLGSYLRDFEALLGSHGLTGIPYGHFGDGCVHVRLDLPLANAPERMRPFITEATDLVLRYGGSPSGEHGDGRARSELLAEMYSPQALTLFRRFKYLFDPQNLLNPGVVVDPEPFDRDLRRPQALPLLASGGFAFAEDGGDATTSFHRCVGVGKCRATSGGFMCPSYRATMNEKDSTRGRARVLQEMANGQMLTSGYASAAVLESLDLCLSCKACGSECPAGVDMATFKAEALHQAYRGKIRPLTHYTLGWLPWLAQIASPFASWVNRAGRVPWLRRTGMRLAGMDERRGLPRFAERRLSRAHMRAGEPHRSDASPGGAVAVWADSFSEYFSPAQGLDMISLLRSAGYSPELVPPGACCGLTWISTGQLETARRKLRSTVAQLAPYLTRGTRIVGIEPSCTAVLRSDLLELLPTDENAREVAEGVQTLAELLVEAIGRGWQPPSLRGETIVVQPHCHHQAVMKYRADVEVLEATGATIVAVEGCCGLAGNFGMERGHYEVSVAVAENGILPVLREYPEALILADGFSCQTQIEQLAARKSMHLASLLTRASTREIAA